VCDEGSLDGLNGLMVVVYVYVCVSVCIYVCMYVYMCLLCMYVCIYVCIYVFVKGVFMWWPVGKVIVCLRSWYVYVGFLRVCRLLIYM
jgi:hypothetical protein